MQEAAGVAALKVPADASVDPTDAILLIQGNVQDRRIERELGPGWD
jgi:hypothetical protein